MGIRFAKSIKIGKYFRINFTKNGISATIGKRGASVNIGGKGTYLNLSPAAVGVKGTGLSYRTKIGNGIFGSSSSSKKKNKKTIVDKAADLIDSAKPKATKKNEEEIRKPEQLETVEQVPETNPVEDYARAYELETNLHKYAENVMNKKQFAAFIDSFESEASREIYQFSADGDEDTVENLVSTFMNNLELSHELRVNYELEDDVLYVDLDLPEIEDLDDQYPVTSERYGVVYRKKTKTMLKEEYANLIMSVGVFLSANFFNLSSYIRQIVMSAFTTVRDNNGDLVDQYLYSVKYDRKVFEKTDLASIDDLYKFILQFDNRINMSAAHTFKAIKPYEMESVMKTNSLIEDAALGLKELGYKTADINLILPELSKLTLETSGEYLKEGLKLLQELKK